jgi:hypothetical protein
MSAVGKLYGLTIMQECESILGNEGKRSEGLCARANARFVSECGRPVQRKWIPDKGADANAA